MNQLWMNGMERDYWGRWNAPTIEAVSILNDSECFVPRWYSAPADFQQVLAANDYLTYQIAFKPGSFIYALLHIFGPGTGYQIQVTDLGLQHDWFSTPMDDIFLNGQPYYLPDIYPIVAPGIIRVQFWNPQTAPATQRAQLIFAVAEPKERLVT